MEPLTIRTLAFAWLPITLYLSCAVFLPFIFQEPAPSLTQSTIAFSQLLGFKLKFPSLFLNTGENSEAFVLASFLASLTVGLISLILARAYRWPSQIFSTPGVLILVPGLLALSAFYHIEPGSEGGVAYRVALTAGAIVFGLLTARMPFRLYTDIDL